MVMTQRTSTCLSLLVLLSSFPLSLGDASHISGSSLIGVTSVSEILDQFFQKRESAGRKTPAWKAEAQAMVSMVQGLNQKGINETTQATVNGYVGNIIEALQGDLVLVQGEQDGQKEELASLAQMLEIELGELVSELGKVKSLSGQAKTCRSNVTSQNASYYEQCSDNDRTGGGSCPTHCGKPDTFDFELNAAAKETYTCRFVNGEKAKQCVDRLREKVNMTRQNLTNKYNAWHSEKISCEAHMERCARCNPLWDAMTGKITVCDGKRDVVYDAYCTLQREQTGFCNANETLYSTWTGSMAQGQVNRTSEYSDLKFLICIFNKYLEIQNFTVPMVEGCNAERPSAADFYAATGGGNGELALPAMDTSGVPQCFGAVSHSEGSPLFDMTGLIDELKTDNLGTTVSLTDHVYAPAASDSSHFCTVLNPTQ